MFRASLCPSSGDQDRVLLHMVFCAGVLAMVVWSLRLTIRSNTWSCSPDDGHNDARNMLR